MSEFKGTKGKLKRKYVSGVCIGIGVEKNGYTEMTANSILPDESLSEDEIEQSLKDIEYDMALYSKAPEMLEMLLKIRNKQPINTKQLDQLIKEATTI